MVFAGNQALEHPLFQFLVSGFQLADLLLTYLPINFGNNTKPTPRSSPAAMLYGIIGDTF